MRLPNWFPKTWIELFAYMGYGVIVSIFVAIAIFGIYYEWVKFQFFFDHR